MQHVNDFLTCALRCSYMFRNLHLQGQTMQFLQSENHDNHYHHLCNVTFPPPWLPGGYFPLQNKHLSCCLHCRRRANSVFVSPKWGSSRAQADPPNIQPPFSGFLFDFVHEFVVNTMTHSPNYVFYSEYEDILTLQRMVPVSPSEFCQLTEVWDIGSVTHDCNKQRRRSRGRTPANKTSSSSSQWKQKISRVD